MRSLVVLSVVFAVLVNNACGVPASKRSVGYGIVVPGAPLAYTSFVSQPVAVSQVVAQPAVVASPTWVKSAVVSTPVVSPSYVYVGGSAVSHQSRVDVKSSPAIVSEQVVQPFVAAPAVVESVPAVVAARSVYVAPTYYAHQPVVSVQSPAYLAESIVSPVLIKKKRSS